MELIVGLNERNHQTFVIVTHDLHIAQSTNRIVNMLDGLIVEETQTERGRATAAAGS
jgi:lipoprotein-releasing system ATP-binding protein